MTFLNDHNTNYQVLSRPQDVEELEFFYRPWITVRGENEYQAKESSKKRKLSMEPILPSLKRNRLMTPDSVQSPNIGSTVRPVRVYDPITPICNLKHIPDKCKEQFVVAHGYLYNQLNVDVNIFTMTSEETYDLSHQFEEESEDKSENQSENAKMFVRMCTYAHNPQTTYLIDSSALVSGVSNISQLNNQQACHVPITPAFGEVIHAQARGTIEDPLIGQQGIPALHIPDMNQNLLSVYQYCTGGSSGVQQMGIFTSEGCRFYPIQPNRDVLKALSDRPRTQQGLADQGVYIYSANPRQSN